MLTIFTPTYNRGYILPKLYESLCRQSATGFEWIVVDDGSTDETEALLRRWETESPFPLRWTRQPNGGKHRAINRGVEMARGDFFFIVDSDDRLPKDAVEVLLRETSVITGDRTFAGVIGLRGDMEGHPMGGVASEECFDGQIREVRYRQGMMQDMAEVVRTDYLRECPFPDIEGERFCTESLVWNRLDRRYRFRFLSRVIYLCEYLEDGLSAGYMRLLHRSPFGAALYYAELAEDRVLPLYRRLRSVVSFWRYYEGLTQEQKGHFRIPPLQRLLRPIGRYYWRKDRQRYDS